MAVIKMATTRSLSEELIGAWELVPNVVPQWRAGRTSTGSETPEGLTMFLLWDRAETGTLGSRYPAAVAAESLFCSIRVRWMCL
jgi:hypothetical protein